MFTCECGHQLAIEPLPLRREGEVAVFCDSCADGGVMNLYGDLGAYLKRKYATDSCFKTAMSFLVPCPCGGRFNHVAPCCPECKRRLLDAPVIPGRFFLEIPFREELAHLIPEVESDARLFEQPATSGLGFCAIRLLTRISPESAMPFLRALFDAYPAPNEETAIREEEAEEEGLDVLSCMRTLLDDLASNKPAVGGIEKIPHPYETFLVLCLMHLLQNHERETCLDLYCQHLGSSNNEKNDWAVHLLSLADIMLVEMGRMFRQQQAPLRYLVDDTSARKIWDRLHHVH